MRQEVCEGAASRRNCRLNSKIPPTRCYGSGCPIFSVPACAWRLLIFPNVHRYRAGLVKAPAIFWPQAVVGCERSGQPEIASGTYEIGLRSALGRTTLSFSLLGTDDNSPPWRKQRRLRAVDRFNDVAASVPGDRDVAEIEGTQ